MEYEIKVVKTITNQSLIAIYDDFDLCLLFPMNSHSPADIACNIGPDIGDRFIEIQNLYLNT